MPTGGDGTAYMGEEGKSLFSTPGLDKLKKLKDFKNNADKVFGRDTKSTEKAHYEPEGEAITEKALSKSQQRFMGMVYACLLYTSPSPRDRQKSRMPSSA